MKAIILSTKDLSSVEKSKADQIKATFEPMVKGLKAFESAYNDVIKASKKGITKEITQVAKRVRIDIAKVRIATEKARKAQKEEYLRAGKAIDGVANILKWAVVEREEKLKEIENHFVIQEEQRLEKLQSERATLLMEFVEDAHDRNLAAMDEDVWLAYFNSKKQNHLDVIAAELKAEKERVAKQKEEDAERKRVLSENEKLRREAEAQQKKIEAERKQREKVEAARLAKEKKENEKREEAYELKLKQERKAREKVELEERLKRKKVEAQLKAELAAKAKAKEDAEKLEQSKLQMADSDKMHDLTIDLKALKTKYVFKSKKHKDLYKDVSLLIDKVVSHINK